MATLNDALALVLELDEDIHLWLSTVEDGDYEITYLHGAGFSYTELDRDFWDPIPFNSQSNAIEALLTLQRALLCNRAIRHIDRKLAAINAE